MTGAVSPLSGTQHRRVAVSPATKSCAGFPGGGFEEIGELLSAGTTTYADSTIEKGTAYAYIVRAISETEATMESEETAPVSGSGEWFHTGKIPLFIANDCFFDRGSGEHLSGPQW